jgi:hypothetical protein
MLFSPDNFLTHVRNLIMGGGRNSSGVPALDAGFVKDIEFLANSVLATSVTRIADSEGFPILSAAASITAVAAVGFQVPRDYDEATDIIKFKFTAKMAGATDVPTLTAAAKRSVLATAATTLTAVSGTPTAALSTTAQQFEIEYRGQGLTRGQRVEFTLTSGAHATDALLLQTLNASYHSTLVSYNELDSSNNALR